MKTADIPDSIEDMAVAGKVVSKRTARAFVEYGMEKETSEHYTTKLQVSTKHAETRPEGTQNMASTTSVIGPAAAAMDGAITHGGSSNSNYRRASTTAASADMDLSDVLGVPRGGASEMGSGDIEPANHTQDSTTTVSRSESPQEDGRPINFGLVLPGIYRSSYPQTRDYPFLESLHLNTVVTLVQKEFPAGYKSFLNKNGIKHHVFDMPGTKKESIPIETMSSILSLVLDQRNHPLLIHCNHGRHRTGCVVAVIRKACGWQLPNILGEYKVYAEPKSRDCDIEYITAFDPLHLPNLWVRPPSRNLISGRRFRHFCRAATVTFFILLIWFSSGSRMVIQNDRPTS